ncbi:MAG: Cys-rich protein [Leptospiraceae bacterium]|nr:Cys-rich protein [Leptospiraceae bacterium]
MLNRYLFTILAFLALLQAQSLFSELAAAECPEICQAYLQCVEKSYPGESTDAQKQTILEGCQSGCQKNLQASNACYEDSGGANGAVASCEDFSNCLLQVN